MKLNFKRKKYLITGASSGLGRELSYFLDKHGADLTIIGSNKKELSKTFKKLSKNKKHHKIIADFSNINKSKIIIKKIFHGHKYNGFINCAGVHTFSSINNLNDDQIIKSFNINSVYPYLILKNFSTGLRSISFQISFALEKMHTSLFNITPSSKTFKLLASIV